MTDNLPDIFGVPSLDLPNSGSYAPRVLVSHGENSGALEPAWEKYGSLEQGDIVIQDEDKFYLTDARDHWFIVASLAFIYSGVRDAWTRELTSASRNLEDSKRGGAMFKQVNSCLIWIPGDFERSHQEDLPQVVVCHASFDKAKTNGVLDLLKAVERLAREESPIPATFRAFAHMYGRPKESRPNEHKKTFTYSILEARCKRTGLELADRLGKALKDRENDIQRVSDEIMTVQNLVDSFA